MSTPAFHPSFASWRAGGYASAAVAPRPADPATLQQLAGETMGTTWSLRFDNPRMLPLEAVRASVDSALSRVVAQMSHWHGDSDVSRYARSPAGSIHTLEPESASVLACALHWAEASGGALDPTIGPLVRLWGFGPQANAECGQPPSAEALRGALADCGWQRLRFEATGRTLEQPGGLTLDFSGIAKGFAVDQVVGALRALQLTDLLMEIGGELRGVGRRPGGGTWSVQIAAPDGDIPAPPKTVALADIAIATSGDRWQQRSHAGRRWSHTIDPRNGEPVGHGLACVTVLRADCMEADALATVLTVLGPVEGPAFADLHHVAALFWSRRGGALDPIPSRAWVEHIGA